jgi:hypothetical protein
VPYSVAVQLGVLGTKLLRDLQQRMCQGEKSVGQTESAAAVEFALT